MERELKTDSRFTGVDLTVPLNKKQVMSSVSSNDCLGKMWDLRTAECSRCSERDVCGIIFSSEVDKKVAEVQDEQGAKFLDLTDFERLSKRDIFNFVISGETSTKDLISYVMGVAETDDAPSAVNFLKQFITKTEGINTKSGIVWLS